MTQTTLPMKDTNPKAIVFSKEAQAKIKRICSRYPKERTQSALLPVLWVAQSEFGGWLSIPAMELVAETLGLPYIRVYEVATFYTMFNLKPVGIHHVQVCTNCACMIRGSDAIAKAVKDFTGISQNKGTSTDGEFTFEEVECLGACVDAPMMQITKTDGTIDYFTNLTADKTTEVLQALKDGKHVSPDTPSSDLDPVSTNPAEGAKGGKK